ncbi:hypothetical protein FA15DRAFT_419035 [Coprinopsis marcescibilis]|uniref:Choline/carnitine acyltransferase domain-containing protein n=1 Tax=Coprinopsis marcescibilis TaxID=230819 RepID=A0A5C3KW15_COPMA|nr:hypothetical protein FA15DRAFT_419035 [Coprinopsis marcescibilis]
MHNPAHIPGRSSSVSHHPKLCERPQRLLKSDEPVPAIYTNKAFGNSNNCYWELSTSQPSSPWFDGWGHGEVVPDDGFGLLYSIGEGYVRWTVTSCEDEAV